MGRCAVGLPTSGSSCRLLIVGAGKAGRAAAEAAASCGLGPLWVDDEILAGHGDGLTAGTRVLNISSRREVLWVDRDRTGTFHAEQIILATGSDSRTVPFPGWTLPGVTIGRNTRTAAKNAGRRVLVAGTGPMLVKTAVSLLDDGWSVLAVLEAAGSLRDDEDRPESPVNRLRRAGIPILHHHTVFSAAGTDYVTRATYGPVDPADWRPKSGEGTTIEVDCLAIEFGRVANNDLAELAGCQLSYDSKTDAWLPVRDETMRTTIPEVFFAGGSGVAFRLVAEHEGRIAGITAAERAGTIGTSEAIERRTPILKKLAECKARRETLEEASRLRRGLDELMNPATVLCPCEGVTLAALRDASERGAGDMTSLKLMTRLGMGACQSKCCGAAGARILASLRERTPQEVGRIHARPPARPVTLGELARMACDSGSAVPSRRPDGVPER